MFCNLNFKSGFFKMMRSGNWCASPLKLMFFVRNLTATEVSTALRPFYFSVHPDLFGQHPQERAINETSLQQLSYVLQSLQASTYFRPVTLQFYIKNKNKTKDTFRLVKIHLKERDLKAAVINILKMCELPTNELEKHLKESVEGLNNGVRFKYNEFDLTKMDKNHPIFATAIMQQKVKEAKDGLKLKNWLKHHFKDALKKSEDGRASREEIERLEADIVNNLGLREIKWDCGWNNTHFRGCLLAFKSLMEQHPEHMHALKDRILVFSYFTGISLDGHVMLYSGEVRHNWLDFIKNIQQHSESLKRVPIFEKTLSHVLRNIKVGRRKFMPKVMVGEYENNLKQITTSINDYIGHKPYPKSWPDSLNQYEIVVESEAGPVMVSPTGQFIMPSALPGSLLISFITNNLEEAGQKISDYKRDKHIEKSLCTSCIKELELAALFKDDNITPDLMIKCCERLLENKNEINNYTKGVHFNISTYYSVLSDGVACIPWNFEI